MNHQSTPHRQSTATAAAPPRNSPGGGTDVDSSAVRRVPHRASVVLWVAVGVERRVEVAQILRGWFVWGVRQPRSLTVNIHRINDFVAERKKNPGQRKVRRERPKVSAPYASAVIAENEANNLEDIDASEVMGDRGDSRSVGS